MLEESIGLSKSILLKFSHWTMLQWAVSFMLIFKSPADPEVEVNSGCTRLRLDDKIDSRIKEKSITHHYFMYSGVFPTKKKLTLEPGKKKLKKQSSLLRLDPIIRNGLLYVEGRLKNLQIEPDDMNHPVILLKTKPRGGPNHLTGHLVEECVVSLIRKNFGSSICMLQCVKY